MKKTKTFISVIMVIVILCSTNIFAMGDVLYENDEVGYTHQSNYQQAPAQYNGTTTSDDFLVPGPPAWTPPPDTNHPVPNPTQPPTTPTPSNPATPTPFPNQTTQPDNSGSQANDTKTTADSTAVPANSQTYIATFDGSAKNNETIKITQSNVGAIPEKFNAVTPSLNVTWESNQKMALIEIKGTKNIDSNTSMYTAIKYTDKGYEYISVSYNAKTDTIIVPVQNKDQIRVVKVNKGVALNDFIPQYENGDYINYMTKKQNGITMAYDGIIPDPVEWYGGTNSTNNGTPVSIQMTGNPNDTSSPSKYNSVDKNIVTPVANQLQTNLCWAFSAISAAETGYIQSFGGLNLFSQSNIAYAASNKVSSKGFVRDIPDPGNFKMSMAYMTRWEGPVSYSVDPFNEKMNSRTEQSNLKDAVAHIQGFEKLPSDFNAVKQAIVKYGSVVSSINVSGNNDSSYNEKTGAYYNSDSNMLPNHAVQIVGWDNDYPAANFASKPNINGAWIIKNSWGTDYGNNGYNYVSYADVHIAREAYAITKIETVDNYDKIYMHDTYGETGRIHYNTNSVWFANSFKGANGKNEKLEAVSFYSSTQNAKYEIWVGENLSSLSKVIAGQNQNVGYYTIKLQNPINLANGNFVVAVKLTGDNDIATIPIETNVSNYITSASAQNGQSFVSYNGSTWSDITEKSSTANVCIRAFTTSEKNYYEPYINGYEDGTFRPDRNITRAEAASLISNALGIKDSGNTSYKDIDTTSWYANSVISLENKGLYNGLITDDKFNPNQFVTREELCFVLGKLYSNESVSSNASTFADIENSYAKSSIQLMTSLKFVNGYPDGTFKPQNNVTRAEFVVVMNKILGRTAPLSASDKAKNKFSDINGHWAAEDIIKASVKYDK